MNSLLENLFLVSAVLGLLLSLALMTYIFRSDKSNFFLGLIILFISIQLLFSWGSYSGYNNSPEAFPFWCLLSYHILPPSILLFVICQFKITVKLKCWYILLYVPAVAEISTHFLIRLGIIHPVNLMQYLAWIWFIDYIPLLGFVFSLGFFWIKYFQKSKQKEFKRKKNTQIPHIKLLLLMSILTLIGLLWVIFSFTGWENFSLIEFLLVFLLFVFSFLIFLDSQPFAVISNDGNKDIFSNYNDFQQLERLKELMNEKQRFIKPDLSLKELSRELGLPSRYLSYLINRYHHKNYKEYINTYRIDAFIAKARSSQVKYKTLLALAFESGFNSKSAFNQAFKDLKGKPPSEYLS